MYKLVFFIGILFITFKSYSQCDYKLVRGKEIKKIKKEPVRLIIYAELNTDTIDMSDSASFFNNKICLKLNIDTIDLSQRKFEVYKVNCLKKLYRIRYKNVYFYLDNFYRLEDYEWLQEYSIKSFWISTNLNMDLFGIESNNNCLNKRQKLFMYNIYTHYVMNTNKVFSYLYLMDIKIGGDNQEENYINIRFSFPNFKLEQIKRQLIVN